MVIWHSFMGDNDLRRHSIPHNRYATALCMLERRIQIAHDTEVDTASSDDLDGNAPPPPSNDDSLNRKRRIRPLSAPVFLPSDHSICDDEGEGENDTTLFSEQNSLLEPFKGIQNEHLYSNQSQEYSIPSSQLVRQQTSKHFPLNFSVIYSYDTLLLCCSKIDACSPLESSDYCEPRPVSDSVAQSVDSAIGTLRNPIHHQAMVGPVLNQVQRVLEGFAGWTEREPVAVISV
uniref:Uncharacterized protein n=1 Tax=Heterorhabditis bacteriophora TaxID=37862 RepID=A0A1I7WUP5_HETBA